MILEDECCVVLVARASACVPEAEAVLRVEGGALSPIKVNVFLVEEGGAVFWQTFSWTLKSNAFCVLLPLLHQHCR